MIFADKLCSLLQDESPLRAAFSRLAEVSNNPAEQE